jgi:hypothetical protein
VGGEVGARPPAEILLGGAGRRAAVVGEAEVRDAEFEGPQHRGAAVGLNVAAAEMMPEAERERGPRPGAAAVVAIAAGVAGGGGRGRPGRGRARRPSDAGNKKPVALGDGLKRAGVASDGFREGSVERGGVEVMAFGALQLMAAVQHAVEFVDEHRDGLVTFVGFDAGVHVGAVDGDVPFGLEARANVFFGVAFQLNADAHDALLVAKQSFGFLSHKRFERGGQLEMNAGDDQFVGVLAVHITAYGLV